MWHRSRFIAGAGEKDRTIILLPEHPPAKICSVLDSVKTIFSANGVPSPVSPEPSAEGRNEGRGDRYMEQAGTKPIFDRSPRVILPFWKINPARLEVEGVSSSEKDPVEETADKLFQYMVEHEPSLDEIRDLTDDALDLGETKPLRCVFVNEHMDEILNNKDEYENMRQVFNAIERKRDELIECLPLSTKLWYGPKVKSVLDRMEIKEPLLDGFSRYYAELRSGTPGAATVDLLSYFFRKDRIDADTTRLFDIVFEKIHQLLLRQNARKRWFHF